MCIFHVNEHLRMYCESCDDVICVSCIEQHQKHNLRDVKHIFDELRDRLRTILDSRQPSALIDLQNCKQLLIRHLSKCEERLSGTETEINDAAKVQSQSITKPIRERKQLLSTAVCAIKSVEQSFYTSTMHGTFDVNCLSDICLAKTYQSLKQCIKVISMIKEGQLANPNFEIAEDTKQHEDTTLNDDDSFARDRECRSTEKSRNKVDRKEEKGTIKPEKLYVFSFSLEEKHISKIVPISTDTCWLIINRNLYKLSQGRLYFVKIDSKCYSTIDDITVLNDSELLLLNKDSCDILLLLEDDQVLNYSVISKYPRFFCQILHCSEQPYKTGFNSGQSSRSIQTEVKTPRLNVIFVEKTNPINEFYQTKIEMKVTSVHLTNHGVQSSETNIKDVTCEEGYTVEGVTNNIVLLSNGRKSKLYMSQSSGFCGMVGRKGTSDGFLSYGMCSDENGNILVTDYNFSKLYLLNKNLCFKKILLDHRSGLHFPSCISLKDDALWVVNKKELLVFDYKQLIGCADKCANDETTEKYVPEPENKRGLARRNRGSMYNNKKN